MEDTDLVAVGLVGKPHGLRGEVYVLPDPDFVDPVRAGLRVRTDRHGELAIAATHNHAGKLLVTFDGIASREAAEDLRGERLLLPRDQVETGEDSIWVEDLLGREVVTPDGEVIGILESVVDGLAHDYFVVARPDGGEVLIPVVEDMVELTDDAVVVRAIPGLLD